MPNTESLLLFVYFFRVILRVIMQAKPKLKEPLSSHELILLMIWCRALLCIREEFYDIATLPWLYYDFKRNKVA